MKVPAQLLSLSDTLHIQIIPVTSLVQFIRTGLVFFCTRLPELHTLVLLDRVIDRHGELLIAPSDGNLKAGWVMDTTEVRGEES